MAEKIQVVVDVNTESVTIATDRTLTLQQQLKVLKKELQTVPEGTQEWNLINSKFNDTKDSLERVNLKSRELFGTLSLLPGPAGAIAGKVNGAIDALKIFSSFKLTDIKAQLSAFGDDLSAVAGFLGKATGITKVYTALNLGLAKAFTAVGVAQNTAAAGARAFAVALTATGIGAIVVALGLAVGALVAFTNSSKDSKDATDDLNASLEKQNELLNEQLGDIDSVNKQRVLRAKIAGKSEEEIYNIESEGREQRLAALRKYDNDLQNEFSATLKNEKLSAEDRNKTLEDIQKRQAETRKNINKEVDQREQADLERQLARTTKARDTSIKNNADAEQRAQKALANKLAVIDSDGKAEDARLAKLKAVGLALAKNEQEKLDVERNFAKLAYDANVADLDKKMALYDKDSLEYKNLQTQKEGLEADYITKLGGFRAAELKLQKETNDAKAEKEKETNEKIAKDREEFVKKQGESAEKEKKYFKDLQDTTEAVTSNMQESFRNLYFSIGNALSSIGNLFEQGSAAQKIFGVLSVAVNAATAIGDIISRTAGSVASYTKSAADSKAAIISGTIQLAAGNPKGVLSIKAGTAGVAASAKGIAAAKASGVAQGIAVSAGAAGQIAAILSAKKSTTAPGGGGGGGDTGGTPAIPFSNPGVGAPQVQAGAAQQGTIAGIVAGTMNANQSQTQPLRAYVVQNDIRTESQLDRRIRTAARLGG